MAGISHIIEHLNLPEEVKADVVAVYQLIAEAESHVHGKTVEEIHFHEVGTADAIADIAGVCLLMHMIAPKKVIASPIHVGSVPTESFRFRHLRRPLFYRDFRFTAESSKANSVPRPERHC